MKHVNADGDTDYDGEDAVASLDDRKRAAITPKSTTFGSPLPINPWTGGPRDQLEIEDCSKPAHAKDRRPEQKPKPSYFELNNIAPAKCDQGNASTSAVASTARDEPSHPLFQSSPVQAAANEHSDVFAQPQKPTLKLPKKASLDNHLPNVVDGKFPEGDRFSDPKDASPTPRPRAATLQDGKGKDNTVLGDQKKKKTKGFLDMTSTTTSFVGQPSDLPRDAKLADAMRGTSFLAPTKKSSSIAKANRNRAANSRMKMTALDLEDPESAGCNSMFDTANMPLSQGHSPGATKKKPKAARKPALPKSNKARGHQSKELPKSQAQATPSAPAKQNKIKTSETDILQDGESIAKDAAIRNKDDQLPRPARQTRRGRILAKQEPMIISDSDTDDVALEAPGPSTDNEDGEYLESRKYRRRGAPAKSSMASKTSQRGKATFMKGSEVVQKPVVEKEEPRTRTRPRDPASVVFPNKASSIDMGDFAIDDHSKIQKSRSAVDGSKSSNAAMSNLPDRGENNDERNASLGEVKTCMPVARKPTIIPFDVSGPKANGVPRNNVASNAPKSVAKASNDVLEGKNAEFSLEYNDAPQNARPLEPKESDTVQDQKSKADASENRDEAQRTKGISAPKEHSSSSKAQDVTEQASHSLTLGVGDNDKPSGSLIMQEVIACLDEHAIERDDHAPMFMDDDSVDEPVELSHNVSIEDLTVSHHDQDEPNADDGYRYGPGRHSLDKSVRRNSVSTENVRKKQRRSPDEFIDSTLAVEKCISPRPPAQTLQRLCQRSLKQRADDSMERPAKKQRTHHTSVAPMLRTWFPPNEQKDLVVSTKKGGGNIAVERRQHRLEENMAPLRRLTSIDSDISLGANPNRVTQYSFVKAQQDNKLAPQKDIAQQFLVDMANRSNAPNREDAFENVPKERPSEANENLQGRDDGAGHRKRALVHTISERERAFEEIPATPDQTLAEVMHRIVGVRLGFHIIVHDCDADHLAGYTSTNEGERTCRS